MSDNIPFLKSLAKSLLQLNTPLHQVMVVLPNKRGELYLKKHLAEILDKPTLSPQIVTIESWVVNVSGLQPINTIDLYFMAYKAYLEIEVKPESFEDFLKWVPSVLHDFNEIDRHLVDANALFENMLDVKTIENWGADPDNPTELIKQYLTFWRHLKPLYHTLRKNLTNHNLAWQGMSYRAVAENLECISEYQNKGQVEQVVFGGFNALNKAEINIIQHLLNSNEANIFWDADSFSLDNPVQEAGMFMRNYKSSWPHFDTHAFNWVEDRLNKPKTINAYGVSGPIGQAKKVGEILEDLKTEDISKVAVVLADEQLLVPVLNAIPEKHDKINITMGVGIQQISITHFTLQYLQICQKLNNDSQRKIYFKDLKSLFQHKVMSIALSDDPNITEKLFSYIIDQNLAYLAKKDIEDLSEELSIDLKLILDLYACDEPISAIKNIEKYLLVFAKSNLQNKLEKEAVYQLTLLLNQLQSALSGESLVQNLEVTIELYRQLLNEVKHTFYGEPLQGLQVMGLLETRTLDFDTIIMTSINEGVLPAGKSQNSFIPFDLRRFFGLPVHTEKDAVYAYHFFRLLKRAKNVHLIYNTVAKGLGSGEKSRFIYQIETELDQVDFKNKNEGIVINDSSLSQFTEIKKSPVFIENLKALMHKGLSPTSFASYIKNPMEFYLNKVLGVREEGDVEEVVGYNTLGTVIHEVLEKFYTPFIGGFPVGNDFKEMHKNIDSELDTQFSNHFKKGRINEGKNLLIFKVAQRFIKRFLTWDLKSSEEASLAGTPLKIIALEKNVSRELYVKELNINVNLIGKIDRLEECGSELRIIDYKTGVVSPTDILVTGLDEVINSEKDKGKALQLMMYAFILNENHPNVVAGIISLRKLSQGLMLCTQKVEKSKNTLVFDKEVLLEFESLLVLKVCEMFDQSVDIQDFNLISLQNQE